MAGEHKMALLREGEGQWAIGMGYPEFKRIKDVIQNNISGVAQILTKNENKDINGFIKSLKLDNISGIYRNLEQHEFDIYIKFKDEKSYSNTYKQLHLNMRIEKPKKYQAKRQTGGQLLREKPDHDDDDDDDDDDDHQYESVNLNKIGDQCNTGTKSSIPAEIKHRALTQPPTDVLNIHVTNNQNFYISEKNAIIFDLFTFKKITKPKSSVNFFDTKPKVKTSWIDKKPKKLLTKVDKKYLCDTRIARDEGEGITDIYFICPHWYQKAIIKHIDFHIYNLQNIEAEKTGVSESNLLDDDPLFWIFLYMYAFLIGDGVTLYVTFLLNYVKTAKECSRNFARKYLEALKFNDLNEYHLNTDGSFPPEELKRNKSEVYNEYTNDSHCLHNATSTFKLMCSEG